MIIMNSIAIYSEMNGEIKKFLELFDSKNFNIEDSFFWEKTYQNPIEMIDLISTFVDNNDKFNLNIWISLDENIYICVNDQNINKIIKYIYERYPY